jgi:hypothetical protein
MAAIRIRRIYEAVARRDQRVYQGNQVQHVRVLQSFWRTRWHTVILALRRQTAASMTAGSPHRIATSFQA